MKKINRIFTNHTHKGEKDLTLSDIEIAQQVEMENITKIAEKLGIPAEDLRQL